MESTTRSGIPPLLSKQVGQRIQLDLRDLEALARTL